MFSQFDRIDHKLLAELDRDSRQSYSQIAKKLRLGSDLIEYRVNRYRTERLIGRFSAVIDPLALGWWVIKVYTKLETSSKKLPALIRALEKHPSTYWLAELYGRFDILHSFCVRDPSECETVQAALRRAYGELILEQVVCVTTSVVRFSKKYLATRGAQEYRFARRGELPAVDPIEAKLLSLLVEDARLSAVEIGERLGLSPAAVRYRIARLEESGVVSAYRFQFNYPMVGLMLCKLLLHLSDHSEEFEKRLFALCREHPQVTCFIKQLGPFPFEMEIEVGGHDELTAFIEMLRTRFDRGIRSSEVLLVKEDRFHRFPSGVPKAS